MDAVHSVGQIVIGEDEVRSDRPAGGQLQGGWTVDRRRGVIALLPQEELEVLAHFRIILDDQDRSRARGHRREHLIGAARTMGKRRAAPLGDIGTSIENTEPFPSSERTRMR